MPGQWSVRVAAAADAEAIASIYAHYVEHSSATFEEEPPSATEIALRMAAIERAGHPFLVAEEPGRIGGYAYCTSHRPRSAYRFTLEDSVYVDRELAGRGLGTILLEALVEAAARAGARRLVAVIADDGEPASVALHERCGFTHAGRLRRVGYKHGRWLDTVLMQRDVGDQPRGAGACAPTSASVARSAAGS